MDDLYVVCRTVLLPCGWRDFWKLFALTAQSRCKYAIMQGCYFFSGNGK